MNPTCPMCGSTSTVVYAADMPGTYQCADCKYVWVVNSD